MGGLTNTSITVSDRVCGKEMDQSVQNSQLYINLFHDTDELICLQSLLFR